VEQITIEALRSAGTATLSAQLWGHGLRSIVLHGVRPVSRGRSFAGPARTLRYVPSREDTSRPELLHGADYPQRRMIESVEAGEVVVVDARGDLRAGIVGDILLDRIAVRGAAALVTDGAVRDSGGIAELELPVFARGASPAWHLAAHEAADLDIVIACAGVQVRPGDVLVGDLDGVVCIPRELAEEIAGPAAEQARLEGFLHERIRAGEPLPGTYPPSDQMLSEYRKNLTKELEP
jgi:regulator of RNase E activity RraA